MTKVLAVSMAVAALFGEISRAQVPDLKTVYTADIVVSSSKQQLAVPVPWNFVKSSYLEIDGTGDLKTAQNMLAPFHLQPIPSKDGAAQMSIFGVNHTHSTLPVDDGKYGEVFITILASPDGTLNTPYGLFVVKIWVTSEAAKVAGNEVWGTNKDVAKISFELDPTQSSVSLTLRDLTTNKTILLAIASTSSFTKGKQAQADFPFTVFTRFKSIPSVFFNAVANNGQNFTSGAKPQIILGSDGWSAALKKNQLNFSAASSKLVIDEDLQFGVPANLP